MEEETLYEIVVFYTEPVYQIIHLRTGDIEAAQDDIRNHFKEQLGEQFHTFEFKTVMAKPNLETTLQ